MAYDPTDWQEGLTAITAERLNNLEDGVAEAHNRLVDRFIMGEVPGTGDSLVGYNVDGWTPSREGVGHYRLTFPESIIAQYHVTVTAVSGQPIVGVVSSTTFGAIDVRFFDLNGDPVDARFFFLFHSGS